MRFTRDCTTLQPEGGKSCKTHLAQGASQSVDGSQSQHPIKTCLWTCYTDRCNGATLAQSTASRPHHQLALAVPLIFITVVITALSTSNVVV